MLYIELKEGDKVITLLSPMASVEVECTFVKKCHYISNKLGKDIVKVVTPSGNEAVIDGSSINEYKTSLIQLSTTYQPH